MSKPPFYNNLQSPAPGSRMIVSKPYKNKKDAKKDLVFLLLKPIWDTMRIHLQSLMPVDYDLVDSKMPVATKGPILEPGNGFSHKPVHPNHNMRVVARQPTHNNRPPPPLHTSSTNSSVGTLSNIQKTIMRPALTGNSGNSSNGIRPSNLLLPSGNAGKSLGNPLGNTLGTNLGNSRNIWESSSIPKTQESGYFGNGRTNGMPSDYNTQKNSLSNGLQSIGSLSNGFNHMSLSTQKNSLTRPFSTISRNL